MKINQATFIGSTTRPEQSYKPHKPSFAFIGRSNVGKSSLINSLLQTKKLAKTSATPGKTKLINYFLINEAWYIVDLPGYGWARVSKEERMNFKKMINNYLLYNPTLVRTFLLIDSRHTQQTIDLDFIHWLGTHQVPLAIILTKTDKLKTYQLQKNKQTLENTLLKTWEYLPPFFITSATKYVGRQELLDCIQQDIISTTIKKPKS